MSAPADLAEVLDLGDLSLFHLMRFEDDLGRSLGRPVELVFSEAMRPERRAYIERDLVPL